MNRKVFRSFSNQSDAHTCRAEEEIVETGPRYNEHRTETEAHGDKYLSTYQLPIFSKRIRSYALFLE